MRRKEQEITDMGEMQAIIAQAQVCHLAMSDGARPYVVPLCFGYEQSDQSGQKAIYFHCAHEGYKIDIIKKNPQVCFEILVDRKTVPAEKPCEWAMKYKTVIGFGKAVFLHDPQAKKKALDIIVAHYSKKAGTYPADTFDKTAVIKVDIEQMTGRYA